MGTATCICIKEGVVGICYVEDLIIYAEKSTLIGGLKTEQAKKVKLFDLEKPVQFLGVELDLFSDGAVGLQQTGLVNKLLLTTLTRNS